MPLTAAQIVAKACSIAHVPGFTQQGGQDLNLTLNDLCQHRNLKMLRKTTTITISVASNGPFTLPTDYYRVYDFFYTVNNFPYKLNELSQEQYDMLFKDPSIANYPQWYATDLTNQQTQSAPLIYVYPQSTSALSATLRYFVNMADISSPESSSTVPWFPDQDYLINATAMRLMKLADDARKPEFEAAGEKMLLKHLVIEGDEQHVAHKIRLDPTAFNLNRALRPTKTQPY